MKVISLLIPYTNQEKSQEEMKEVLDKNQNQQQEDLKKLTKFCELLSIKNKIISCKYEKNNTQNIIIFSINNKKTIKWYIGSTHSISSKIGNKRTNHWEVNIFLNNRIFEKHPFLKFILINNNDMNCFINKNYLNKKHLFVFNLEDMNIAFRAISFILEKKWEASFKNTIQFLITKHISSIDEQAQDAFSPIYQHYQKEFVKLNIKVDLKEKSKEDIYSTISLIQGYFGIFTFNTINKNFTSFYFAAKHGHTDILEFILNNNISINTKNHLGQTFLHCAIEEEHLKTICFLLEQKASIKIQDRLGNTPLHIAVNKNYQEVVKKLLENLENNDDPNIENNNNKTPLDIATQKKYTEIAKLIKQKIDKIKVQEEIRIALIKQANDSPQKEEEFGDSDDKDEFEISNRVESKEEQEGQEERLIPNEDIFSF
jgi:hypothetical protein